MSVKLCKDCKHCNDVYGSAFLVTGVISEDARCGRGLYRIDDRQMEARCKDMRTHPLPEIYLPFGPGITIGTCGPEGKLFEAKT